MSTQSATLPRATFPSATIAGEQDAATEDIRVYRGRTVDELIPKIEAELGLDAIVVRRHRGLEGGIGGFFQRPFVEIQARAGTPRVDLYDEDPGNPALPPAPGATAPQPALRRPAGAYVTDTLASIAAAGAPEPVVVDPPVPALAGAATPPSTLADAPGDRRATVADPPEEFRELTPAALSRPASAQNPRPRTDADTSELHRERLADTFAVALAEATALPEEIEQPPTPDALGAELELIERPMADMHVTRPRPAAPAPRQRARASIEASLTELGMSEQFARELLDIACAHVLALAPRLSLQRAVRVALMQSIPAAAPLPATSATVALVGPGGSGKTSCCAALLHAYRKGSTMEASCATIMLDDELRTPSMLLSPQIMTPTPIASRSAAQALRSVREDGLLLLDLPPLSPAERPAIRTIATLLGGLEPQRTIVALPATLGAKAAAQLLQALRPLGADAVAITHADETDQLGVAVEAACRFGLAPEYLSDRGRARGGLTRLDPTDLAERLLP
jgi:flagellar biosynthesis GTPase FlhF